MTFDEINRFSPLFASSRKAGAAAILNRNFGFDPGQAVPLSISHGVDFNMCRRAMDVHGIEPLHWAYNKRIYQRAKILKPAVRLPHPWWFVARNRETRPGDRILVVGAPPGRVNDERLLALLRNSFDLSDVDMLLKQRGDVAESAEFWRKQGCRVVSAGPRDEEFYVRLYHLVANCAEMVCCTVSSAAFFAASLNKSVRFLEDYVYVAYEVPNYLEMMDFESLDAREVVRTFLGGNRDQVSSLASELLGFTSSSIDDLKSCYLEAISSLQRPTRHDGFLARCKRELALVTGRPGLASMSCNSAVTRLFKSRKVIAMEISELSLWRDGISDENFRVWSVPYVKGRTEPGYAV